MLSKSAPILMIVMMALAGAAQADNSLEITGDFETSADNATANMLLNERVDIPMLQMRAGHYMVTLFFSRDFTPATGAYPVQFNYLNDKNVLGGSVIVSGDDFVMLSYDTEGTAVFETFDDQIKGTFEFISFDGPNEPRKQVTVKARFDMPRGEAFR